MKLKPLFALGLIALILGGGIVWAAQTYLYHNVEDATVGIIEVTQLLDNVTIGETQISWGEVYPNNMYVYNLTVVNDTNATIMVYRETSGLPAEWTEIWTANGTTLDYQEAAVGWLNLTVPLSASPGTVHNWDGYIKGEYT